MYKYTVAKIPGSNSLPCLTPPHIANIKENIPIPTQHTKFVLTVL